MKQCCLLFLSFFIYIHASYAQESNISVVKENGKHYKSIEFRIKKNTFYTQIVPKFLASSMSIESNNVNSFSNAYILLGGTERFDLVVDQEQTDAIQEIAERKQNQSSGLYIAEKPFEFFSFYSGELEGFVRIHLLYASPMKNSYLRDSKKKSSTAVKQNH